MANLINDKTINYIKRLERIGLKQINTKLLFRDKQPMECLLCGNIFNAIPCSKFQHYTKSGIPGCAKCVKVETYKHIKQHNIEKIQEHFYIRESTPVCDIINSTKILVKNKVCGHEFKVKFGNLLNRNVNCPICNTENKRQRFNHFNEIREAKVAEYKYDFDLYSHQAYTLTRKTYKKFKQELNPNNLPRKRSGQDGYHLDHILSVKKCFEYNIPVELCAHKDNLRMVPWKINAIKYTKIPDVIPAIFENYLPASKPLSSSSIETVTESTSCQHN